MPVCHLTGHKLCHLQRKGGVAAEQRKTKTKGPQLPKSPTPDLNTELINSSCAFPGAQTISSHPISWRWQLQVSSSASSPFSPCSPSLPARGGTATGWRASPASRRPRACRSSPATSRWTSGAGGRSSTGSSRRRQRRRRSRSSSGSTEVCLVVTTFISS